MGSLQQVKLFTAKHVQLLMAAAGMEGLVSRDAAATCSLKGDVLGSLARFWSHDGAKLLP